MKSFVDLVLQYSIKLSLLLAGLTLMLYAYVGQYVRMMADDYCTAYRGKLYGVWNGVRVMYETWASNYTNFAVKFALSNVQPAIHPWIGIITLLGLFSAFYYALYQSLRLIRFPYFVSRSTFFLSVIVTFVFYRIMPSYQHAWWYSAVIPYTWSLVLLIFWIGSFIHYSRYDYNFKRFSLMIVYTGVMAFILGGFVETIVTFLLSSAGLVLLGVLWKPIRRRREIITFSSIVLLVGLICLLIALWSPGANNRREVVTEMLDTQQMSLLESLPGGVVYTVFYTFGELFGYGFGVTYIISFLGFLAFILFFSALILLGRYPDYRFPLPKSIGLAIILIGIVSFINLLATIWPLYYSAGVIGIRPIILPRLIQLITILSWMYLLIGVSHNHQWLRSLRRTTLWQYVMLISALMLVLVPIISMVKLAELVPSFQQYAESWDQRHSVLAEYHDNQGIVHVDPLAYDIEDLLILERMVSETGPQESIWVNTCIARFYELENIYVNELPDN